MDYRRKLDVSEPTDTQATGNEASLLYARVVVVHDQQEALDRLTAALRQAGHDVADFDDPIAALLVLDTVQNIQVEAPDGIQKIDRPTLHRYDGHDINFLSGFANVLAEAVATTQKNKDLSALLDQQKLLAEELQHRVRNNLLMVTGMLASCARSTSDDMTRQDIGSISRRVMTLAQIYDSLLGVGLSDTIDLGFYLQKLCASLPGLQGEQTQKVDLICCIESILLPLNSVTALGMAVTELVTNGYRHAFPGQEGTITVTLARSANVGEASLTVQDNGRGFAATTATSRRGIGLVRRLMEQIGGTLDVQSEGGTQWALTFPVPVGVTT